MISDDKIPLGKAEDLRNKKFGRLTPLYRIKNKNGKTRWRCQCDCGNIIDVGASNLKQGTTKSCGCYKIEVNQKQNFKDLTGKKFGRLTVLYRVPNPKNNKHSMWHCRCDCGTEKDILGTNLIQGGTVSCGCYSREKSSEIGKKYIYKIAGKNLVDLTEQKFGKWTVLYRATQNQSTHAIWHCKCECGTERDILGTNLITEKSLSCGCDKISKGEKTIITLFQKNNISFETQKSFNNFRYKNTNGVPKFDFFVNNKYLLEFDGIQHFKPVGWGEKEFEKNKYRDKEKNEYCKKNGIPLIRIPYTKLDTLCLEDLLLETTEFRVA